MMIRVVMLAVTMSLAANLPASAQEKRITFGEGSASCRDWTSERQKNTGLGTELTAWVRGYVSGVNAYAQTDFLRQTNINAINLSIDNYCRSKPLENLVQVTDAIVNTLHAQALGRK
jgi:hypothetical protein